MKGKKNEGKTVVMASNIGSKHCGADTNSNDDGHTMAGVAGSFHGGVEGMSTFKQIPLAAIKHSPFNPRRQPTPDDPKVKELAASIKAVGLIQPISVSKHGMDAAVKGHELYQIIAGSRRFEAAKLAGLEEIAAMVHQMSVDDALKITVTENLQREDLTPLEEGRGIASLLESGRSTDEIAADIAKSPTWVRRRAKLAELSGEWQAALEGPFSYLSAAHLEVIAHLPAHVQNELLEDLEGHDGITLLALKGRVRNYTAYLEDAPFNTKPCDKCAKRTDREEDLFAGMESQWNKAKEGKAKCLDKQCWEKLTDDFLAQKAKEIKKKTGVEPIKFTNGYRDTTLIRCGELEEIEEDEAESMKAIPAMAVDGPNMGKLIWILPPKNKDDVKDDPEPEKREATLEQKRLHFQIHEFNSWLAEQEECPESVSMGRLLNIVAVIGCRRSFMEMEKKIEMLRILNSKNDAEEACNIIWGFISHEFSVRERNPEDTNAEYAGPELAFSLETFKINPEMYQERALKAFPDPKKITTKKGAKK